MLSVCPCVRVRVGWFTLAQTHTVPAHSPSTWGNVPDQQGGGWGEDEAMSRAAVQDRVPGDLQRQLGLEVLVGQTVGAL